MSSDLGGLLKSKLPPVFFEFVQAVGRLADQSGHRAVVVGGVVRNLFLGHEVTDVDIMSEAPLEALVQSAARFVKGELVSHPRFMTFTVKAANGVKVDFVTAREEIYEKPAALPTVKASTLEKDFKRRDFTVNAMACSINASTFGQLMDPLNGRVDVEKKQIRVLHPLSFQDDPTRLFRAARFAARCGFAVETASRDLIDKAVRERLAALLSPVRRRHEFEMILKEDRPAPVFDLLEEWGVLAFVYEGCRWSGRSKDLFGPTSKFGEARLLERLRAWVSTETPARARAILAELQFEKKTKQGVLAGR